MKTWAGYAAEGRECLLRRDYQRLGELIDANFDLRARIYQIDQGNLEMVHAARKAGASATSRAPEEPSWGLTPATLRSPGSPIPCGLSAWPSSSRR